MWCKVWRMENCTAHCINLATDQKIWPFFAAIFRAKQKCAHTHSSSLISYDGTELYARVYKPKCYLHPHSLKYLLFLLWILQKKEKKNNNRTKSEYAFAMNIKWKRFLCKRMALSFWLKPFAWHVGCLQTVLRTTAYHQKKIFVSVGLLRHSLLLVLFVSFCKRYFLPILFSFLTFGISTLLPPSAAYYFLC